MIDVKGENGQMTTRYEGTLKEIKADVTVMLVDVCLTLAGKVAEDDPSVRADSLAGKLLRDITDDAESCLDYYQQHRDELEDRMEGRQ